MANTIKWIRQNISHFPVNHSVFHASAWMITATDVSVQGNFSTSVVCYWQNGLLLSSKTSKVVPMRAHTICIPSWFELKDSLWRYTGRPIIHYLFSHTLEGDTSHPEEQYMLCKHIDDGRLKAFCTQQNKIETINKSSSILKQRKMKTSSVPHLLQASHDSTLVESGTFRWSLESHKMKIHHQQHRTQALGWISQQAKPTHNFLWNTPPLWI